jgi:hypothetical protein
MKTKLDRRQLSLSLWHLVDAFREGMPKTPQGTDAWKDDRTFHTVYDRILHDFDAHCVGWEDGSLIEAYQDAFFMLLRIMGEEVYGRGFQAIYDRTDPPNYITTTDYGPGDAS